MRRTAPITMMPSIIRSGPIPASRERTSTPRPAVFLDRDGTLIEHVHHLSDPGRVRLYPGAGEALRRLEEEGFARVLVTNQSVVGRGLVTTECIERIHEELLRQLAEHGASLDALYFCPIVPTGDDRARIHHPDRKPGPGMLLRAAGELGLNLAASWMVGDMISDVLAGYHARCRGSILVLTGLGGSWTQESVRAGARACSDVAEAVDFLVRGHDG